MEGDLGICELNTEAIYFYPRPPGGGRPGTGSDAAQGALFLSTPSGWRATCPSLYINSPFLYFYPRPPGGGRRSRLAAAALYPHFYPRPPGGGRPKQPIYGSKGGLISIHALRVEGDLTSAAQKPRSFNFYPRPPGGGRRSPACNRAGKSHFYPRPPGGGRQQKRTKFSSVFAQKGEEFASLRRGKRKFAGGVLKRTNFGF